MQITTRHISILQDINNKYAYVILDNDVIIYQTDFIYDEIYALDNQLDPFMEVDLVRVKIGALYGIQNTWTNTVFIPMDYTNLDILVLHNQFYITATDINDKKLIYNKNGQLINSQLYDDIKYMGLYVNKYYFLIEQAGEVGIINNSGEIIVPKSTDYTFEYFRINNYLVLKQTPLLGQTIFHYDIYNTHGVKLYENLLDYNFLNV
jgi:hypothetical protein